MKKIYPLLDFIKFPVPGKTAKGRTVVEAMTGNPNFPNPDIPLEEVAAATDLLESKYMAARGGNKEETALMYKAELAWDKIMRKLVKYVDGIADGDEAIILSSGLTPSRQPVTPIRPELSVMHNGLPGAVILRRKAVKGARSYIWQYCIGTIPETDAQWTLAEVTAQASVEIFNLVPVTKYWFRVAVVSINGTSAYSDPVMHVVA